MKKTDERTDIELSDVFISWTLDDKTLKDAIKDRLRGEDLKCTDSEEACQGNFEQWSEQAARSSSVFLLILTNNSLYESKYVPRETRSALKMDDAANRIIVVCPDRKNIYNNERFGENGERILRDEHISVIEYEGDWLTEQKLDEIYKKVTRLITNRFFHIYNNATAADYIELVPLYKKAQKKTQDMPHLYKDLYVSRTITEIGTNGEALAEFSSPADLIDSRDVLFLVGEGGSGKSQYLKQIRHTVDDHTLMIALPCSKVANSAKPLFDDMYDYFRGKIGDRDFYSKDNFRRLLAVKKLLLVLDGMDEIPTERITRKFLDKVREFYEPNSEDTTLLFTGRNEVDAGYITLGGKKVRKFRLNKLTDEDIKRLGDNLFLVLGNRDKGEEFYVNVKDLNDEIKSNPLLLSQLAIIYNDSGKIPESIVGIFDAVSEIMFKRDSEVAVNEIPVEYRNIIENDLGVLLKEFAAKRYMRISQGKAIKAVGIFQELLKNKYAAEQIDCSQGARFLLEYIKGRAIYIENEYDDGGEFYHKMFSEYFTAVYYYEKAFNLYDEIEDGNVIAELFSHYADAYWAKVLQLFLVKADSIIDRQTTEELYNRILLDSGINEYTLLFDSCRDLIKHKQAAQTVLVCDILQKSVSGVYPPYGPLFWYVPEYELYETALLAVQDMSGNAKALALVRDVCYIYGQKNNIKDITDRVSGRQLFDAASAELTGVRRALCEIFYLGDTEYDGGKDIYPRCFNVAETLSFRDNSCGIIGRMNVPFDDELGLYSHKSYNLMNGDVIGLVSCPYNIAEVESTLGALPCRKLIGLIFSPTDETEFKFMNFTRCFVRVLYVPENIVRWQDGYRRFMPLIMDFFIGCGALYLFGDVTLPIEFFTEKYQLFNCDTITSISIPKGVTEIHDMAFHTCRNLKAIQIPDGLDRIGLFAFGGCSSLVEICIPDGVAEIGRSAFSECTKIKMLSIPKSVTYIGEGAFSDCIGLQEIQLHCNLTKIAGNLFIGCDNLQEICIPEGVNEIGENAFMNCSSLKEILIPDNVTIIGLGAFEACEGIKEIKLPRGITKINGYTFFGCDNLQTVLIPEGVKEIKESAFAGCKWLTEIEIPDSVEFIGVDAFKYCVKLKKIVISEIFKDNIQYIGFAEDAHFIWRESNGRKKTVVVTDSEPIIASYLYRAFLRVTLPPCLKKINEEILMIHRFIEEANIAHGTNTIKCCEFFGCINLEEIRIPDGVKIIEEYAFAGCRSLKEIYIPNSVKSIKNGTFECCISLQEICIPNSVNKIGEHIFAGCSSLKTVKMFDGIKVIGSHAFCGCENLQEICIPNSVDTIEPGAFEDCISLQKIESDGVKEIGANAFYGCSSLTTVQIPAEAEKIETGTFDGCRSLQEITIPKYVRTIEFEAFWGCSGLREIEFPDSVEFIGGRAFENCTSLSEITIPKSVIDIGDDAFNGCTGLKSVTISINFKNDIRRIFGDIDPSIIHYV
ncbi:MAG: leucine-rich repeat protein [Clostridiales bacterium]|nr:leucine-rich repeat protein [Clostridiales bacterium]